MDGANCDNVAANDRAGHSLILQNGLIRVSIDVPANAEFSISVVSDPYGCALRVDPKTGLLAASLYRKARQSARAAGLGAVSFMQLEAPNGRLCAVGGGDLVLVVVAEPAVNVGLVRVELLRAVGELLAVGGADEVA